MRRAAAVWAAAVCLLAAGAAAAIRDVRLVLPPVVRAGGATTLICLYDMEGAPLYAVKWYRGTREFYRYVPRNRPPGQALPFPGISVDLGASNERQVTLRAVPPHLSGSFSCEVSADAPSFSTVTVNDSLTVTEFPDIQVDSDLLAEGELLTVNCSYPELPPHMRSQLTFYVNGHAVPPSLVQQWEGGASLRFLPRADDATAAGALRLRCVLLVDGQYPLPSDSVAVWLPARGPGPEPQPAPSPGPPPAPPPPRARPPAAGRGCAAAGRAGPGRGPPAGLLAPLLLPLLLPPLLPPG